jgi:HlyD family secretion protein
MHAFVLAAVLTVTAPANGTVAEVQVQSGDGVTEGQVVIELDTTAIDKRFDAATADAGAADEARDNAALHLDAFTRIDEAITRGNMDAATLEAEAARKAALGDLERQRQLTQADDGPREEFERAVDAVRATQAAVDEVHWRAAHPKGGPSRGAQLRNELASAKKRSERAAALVARVQAELAAAHVASTGAGSVKDVLVTVGQHVRAGQALVKIDTEDQTP